MLRKLIIHIILLTFTLMCFGPLPDAHAQMLLDLPDPGQMIHPSNSFNPLEIKGIKIYPHNPLRFDFLVDKGESHLRGQVLKDEITKVAKYFLTCLTVPEKDLWVNLSPYEKDHIAADDFGVTEMGKALLEQDYLLKQIMASLSYPENQLGKEFWQKVYRKANELYGRTDIPVNAFNKVWIVPQSAQVYVKGSGAFIVHSRLDVMLETDYKALTRHMHKNNTQNPNGKDSQYSLIYAQIVKDVILPQLKEEINEGKNFAQVRQVYNAMILATWYKRHLKDSLLGKAYVGQNKVVGVDVKDREIKERIFEQYLKAYKKCVYSYVRQDYDPLTQTTIPRKYTSGGMDFAMFGLQGDKVYSETLDLKGMSLGEDLAMATVDLAAATNDGKVIDFPDGRLINTDAFFREIRTNKNMAIAGSLVTKIIPEAIDSFEQDNLISHFFPHGPLEHVGIFNPWPAPVTLEERDHAQTASSAYSVSIKQQPLMRSSRWLDVSGWLAGMLLGISVFGTDAVSLLATAMTVPFLTRLSYVSQMWFHEVIGHALPATLLYPKHIKKVFTAENLKAHFSLNQWLQVLLPWKTPQEEDPYILFPSEGLKDQLIRKAGFVTTSVLAATSVIFLYFSSLHHAWLMPLLGPVGVSGWAMIKAAWKSDIRSKAKPGKFDCGNYGIFWVGSGKEGINPLWVQNGLDGMLRRLIVRGGQSAGQTTIIDEQMTKEGQDQIYLTKVVKSKRGKGSDLVKTLLKSFGKDSNKAVYLNGSADVSSVFGINGHVRYATGGPVYKEASHPHMGPEEHRLQWALKDGRFEEQEKNVFVVISHNGDNDAYRLLDRELSLEEIRSFFPQLLNMKKDVYIPATENSPSYHDYMALGDSPPVALQIHFHLTQGSWKASIRFAHTMINHNTADEALGDILPVDQQNILAQVFDEVFAQNAAALSRPSLKRADKNFKDLWVTKEFLEHDPGLRYQYEAINRFKEALIDRMQREIASHSEAGKILSHWKQSPEQQQRFVDMVVEKFFTGDRWHAVQEFRERANGSYGLVVRTSLQNDGVTIFSRAQGMTLGYNLSKKFFAFASDPLVLQGPFGERGRLEQLFILDPRGNGEVADIGFSASNGLYMRVFSTEKKRDLTLEEMVQRSYPLSEQNPYYVAPLEYADPKEIIDEDLKNTTAALADRVAAWNDPQSPDRQSAEALVELETSRYIESFFKEHSLQYSLIRPMVIKRLNDIFQDCLVSPKGCTEEQKEFLRYQAAQTAQDSIIASYVENKADRFLAKEADKAAADLIAGRISDESLYVLGRQIDGRLKALVEDYMKQIVDGFMNHPTQERQYWEKIKAVFKQANPDKKTDLFIAGYEKSLWLGETLKDMILTFMPRLNVEVTSSNKNLKDPFQYGIHRRTVALIISLSGSTFPSMALASLLKKMTNNNTFVMTSRMDAMINMALGQHLNPDAPFSQRVFLTGNYYPAEAAPTSDILLYAEQMLMLLHLVKRLRILFPHHHPWGLQVQDADIKRLEGMIQGMLSDSKRITGYDERHHKNNDPVHENLIEHGQYLASHLLEAPKVNFMFRAFVFSVFIFGAPIHKALVLAGVPIGSTLGSWSGLLTASADAFLAMFMPFILTTLVYRSWTHRPRWARMGAPSMVIGDSPTVHQITEAYISKLGALAPASMVMNVHGGNPEDHFGARYAHRIVRGTEIVAGLPSDRDAQGAVVVTLKQAKGIKNGILGNRLKGGAEVTTVGRSDFVNKDATDHHINIGGQSLTASDSDLVKRFAYLGFDAFGRLLAYKVMFNAMYAKASSFTVVPAMSINLGIGKVSIEPKKFYVWNRAWTYPSISVHTTRSPIGINDEMAAKVDSLSNEAGLDQQKGDSSMIASPVYSQVPEQKGGIDLDSNLMKLDIQGKEPIQKEENDNAMILTTIRGLIPEVSTIVPVTPGMLQSMLGQAY